VRTQAAKALLAYQKPKQRAKPLSKTPAQLHRQNALSVEQQAQAEWRRKSEEIRKRHAEKQNDS
ncbi:MAG: hypothetical protein K8F30_12850, partial [Taibaiella sp.]|nr:hypothetical protein [Taibaiella sp.]